MNSERRKHEKYKADHNGLNDYGDDFNLHSRVRTGILSGAEEWPLY